MMTTEQQLNDLVPNSGSLTSIESAQKFAQSGGAGAAGVAVLNCIASQGVGLSCFEVEKSLNMRHQTASGRITVLRKKLALIYYDGTTHYNAETNRNCEVYKLVTNKAEAQRIDPKCGRDLPQSAFKEPEITFNQDEAEFLCLALDLVNPISSSANALSLRLKRFIVSCSV